VASCRFDHPLPAARLAKALNARLPGEIRVLDVSDVEESFHARYSALSKTYRYFVLNADVVSPFERRYVWHLPQRLDVGAMASAVRHLEGERDFAALQGAGSATTTTVRTMAVAVVRESAPPEAAGGCLALHGRPGAARLIVFEFTGSGFLRHMVRNAVGTLVEVGLGKREPSWMAAVLASRCRAEAGPTAPASGLFLVSVTY